MLDAIRKHAQGWIAGFVIALISLAFALWGVEHYLTGRSGGDVVAKIDGTQITHSQVKRLYSQIRQRMLAQLGPNFPMDQQFQKVLKQQALRDLINRVVISQAAEKAGYSINPEQVAAEIRHNPAFQINGTFSQARFRQVLQNLGYVEEEFMDQYSQSMVTGQIQSGIQGTAFSLSSEVKHALELSEQQRSFKFIEIPLNNYIKNTKVSDTVAKAYYDKHKDLYHETMKVRLDYVELSVDEFKKKVKVDVASLKTFYQENITQFSTPKEWHVTQWKINLGQNADPDAIKKSSEQLESIKRGKKDANVKPVTKWIKAEPSQARLIEHFTKTAVGQFSKSFRTLDGLEMLKVLAVKDPQPKPFDTILERVKQAYIHHEVQNDFVDQTEQLSELAYTNPDSLSAIADELGLAIKTSDYFDASGSKTGLASGAKVRKAAFSEDVLTEGNNSGAIEIGPGHIIVLRIKDKIPVKPKAFETVKADIKRLLKRKTAKAEVAKLGNQLLQHLKRKQSVSKILSKHKLKWQSQVAVGRTEAGVGADILKLAFSISDPKFTKSYRVAGRVLDSSNYALVQLDKIIRVDEKKANKERHEVFSNAIESMYGKLEFDLYLKSLMDAADIQITPSRP